MEDLIKGEPSEVDEAWCFALNIAKIDQDTMVIPWAAESWHVVDGTTIGIVLREGIKFRSLI